MTNVSITPPPLPPPPPTTSEGGLKTVGADFENDLHSFHFYNDTNFTTAIPSNYSTGLDFYSQVLGIELWQLILICSCVLLAVLGVIAMLLMWKFVKPKTKDPPPTNAENPPGPGAQSASGATEIQQSNQRIPVETKKTNFCPCFNRSKDSTAQNSIDGALNQHQTGVPLPGIPDKLVQKPRLPPIPEEMDVSRNHSLVTLSKVYPIIKGIPVIQIPPEKFRPLPPLRPLGREFPT